MKVVDAFRRLVHNSDSTAHRLSEIAELHKAIALGVENQSGLLNEKLEALVLGMNNESRLFDEKLEQLKAGANNQSGLLHDKLEALIKGVSNQSRLLNDKLEQIKGGSANQSRLLNDKLEALIKGMNNQSRMLDERLAQLVEGVVNQSRLLNDKLLAVIERQNAQIDLLKADIAANRSGNGADLSSIQAPPVPDSPIEPLQRSTKLEAPATEKKSFNQAMSQLPLMIAAKTYNTSHPDYNADLVRNFPGKILNLDKSAHSNNVVYASVKKLMDGDNVPDQAWDAILKEMLEEARTVPHSDQVFERREYIENYLKELNEKYEAHYAAGWVNLDDALFLYWLVRKLNPKTIVQTGVCNGLSSAFMMLGLVKNGPQGSLHVIDLPPVFSAKDAAWTIKDKVYGVVIPEGKSSGWIVPDQYRDRFEVWNGDAKILLPKMIDHVDAVDLFYHDSDHTYDHMMFEFREAKRKLNPGGLIVGDDISWNASVWDFADQYGVPSYNYKGAVGVAFF